jgi:DNA-binding HxlR family transcriptional regulator
VYRYSSKLGEVGILERLEEPGVPSKVTHSLAEPKGRELYELVVAYANASFTRLPDGRIGAHAWGSLAMLADLWESGLIEELNLGPKSPTELARVEHGLSYQQLNRREPAGMPSSAPAQASFSRLGSPTPEREASSAIPL